MPKEILSEILIKNAEFCVIDVETTGMSPSYCRIIEIGMVRVKNLKIIETYRSFINPGVQVPGFITELTGITDSDVADAPLFDNLANIIKDFIGNSIVTGHNLQFDLSFLNKAFAGYNNEKIDNPHLCTLKLARKLYPHLHSKSLKSVTENLKIRHKDVHRALGDATVTAKILIKMIKELTQKYGFKTISELIGYQAVPEIKSGYKVIKKRLIEDYNNLPDAPGVYFFKNARDEIIYIGKAKSLRNRVRNYFSSTSLSKYRKIMRHASSLGFERTNSELTAFIAEAEMIKIYKPVYNILLKKYPQTFFLRMVKDTGFPVPEFTSKFHFDGNDYFGPYPNRNTANTILNIINSTFSLRECKDRVFKQGKECYLFHIGRCLGPCKSHDLEEYQIELKNVYEFLSGKNQFALDKLLKKMKFYSTNQRFEEAAELRDMVQLLLSQIHKSSFLSEPVNSANVLIEVNTWGKKDFILLHAGKVFIKDYFLKSGDIFDTALDDYFENVISLVEVIDESHLEKLKITLSWLIRNRNSVKLFYLKDFNNKYELLKNVSLGISSKIMRKATIKTIMQE
jgi:DNA polymerase-3 subunit epsilon